MAATAAASSAVKPAATGAAPSILAAPRVVTITTPAAASSAAAASSTLTPPPPLFEAFIVVTLTDQSPKYRHVFPIAGHLLQRRYPHLLSFLYPEPEGTVTPKTHRFIFVMTNDMGYRLYGHCLRTLYAEVYCFISHYCWPQFFEGLLNQFRTNGENLGPLRALQGAYMPPPGDLFVFPAATLVSADSIAEMQVRRPLNPRGDVCGTLPLKLLQMLGVNDFLNVIEAYLAESRIIIVGDDITEASQSVVALLDCTYPFAWPHVLVTCIPDMLLEVVSNPTPFLIGLTYAQFDTLSRGALDGVVVVRLGRFPPSELGIASHISLGMTQIVAADVAGGDYREQTIEVPFSGGNLPYTGPLSAVRLTLSMAKLLPPDTRTDEVILTACCALMADIFGRAMLPHLDPDLFESALKSEHMVTAAQAAFAKAVTGNNLFHITREQQVPLLERAESCAKAGMLRGKNGWVDTLGSEGTTFRDTVITRMPLLFPHAALAAKGESSLQPKEGASPWQLFGQLCRNGSSSVY